MTHPDSPTPAVILFDGICNLCNSTVAWVIEHDRRQRFSFASLQSAAAADLLRSAGADRSLAVSDSMVLVDAAGVHGGSDAVLRIARGLGFPWSLAAVLALAPRPLRDEAYAWIARHRYRWFGTRESCYLPTSELRARFLDAAEPDRPAETRAPLATLAEPTAATPLDPASVPPGPVWTFALRCILIYVFFFVFPFPLGTPPLGLKIPGADKLMHAFVPWVGKTLFGLQITQFPAGSGDTTYNYVEVLVYVVVAILGAILWTAIRRGRAVGSFTFEAVTIYVRYFLAGTLLSYGLDKMLLLQFPAPGPYRLMVAYGESSPFGLLWTSMGASPLYQFFSGFSECVSGLLLLWRRTTLLGALLAAGVLLNVVMLNAGYDVPVKIFSFHLLLLALFVAAPYAGRLTSVLLLDLPIAAARPRPLLALSGWRRRALLALQVAFLLWLTLGQGVAMYRLLHPTRALQADRPLHGTYAVESFTLAGVADRALPDPERWVRVGIDGRGYAAIRYADGHLQQVGSAVDADKKTLTFENDDGQAIFVLTFDPAAAGVVALQGSAGKRSLAVRLKRDDTVSVLTAHGFRWINEFPDYQ